MIHSKILETTKDFDHIIWDWNGTLVDDVDIAVEAVNVLLIENDLPPLDADSYRRVFGFPIKKYYEKIGFDFSKVPFEDLCQRFVQEYNVKRSGMAQLFHGIPELLASLKTTKTQSILSAAQQQHLNEITEFFKIHDLFHYRYGIDDHFAASKLQRGQELIRHSGIPAEKTILIGDTDHDFEVAEELGISCLLVADGHQPFDHLTKFTSNVVHGRRRY